MRIQGKAFTKSAFLLNQWALEKLQVLVPKGQKWTNVLNSKTQQRSKTKHQ